MRHFVVNSFAQFSLSIQLLLQPEPRTFVSLCVQKKTKEQRKRVCFTKEQHCFQDWTWIHARAHSVSNNNCTKEASTQTEGLALGLWTEDHGKFTEVLCLNSWIQDFPQLGSCFRCVYRCSHQKKAFSLPLNILRAMRKVHKHSTCNNLSQAICKRTADRVLGPNATRFSAAPVRISSSALWKRFSLSLQQASNSINVNCSAEELFWPGRMVCHLGGKVAEKAFPSRSPGTQWLWGKVFCCCCCCFFLSNFLSTKHCDNSSFSSDCCWQCRPSLQVDCCRYENAQPISIVLTSGGCSVLRHITIISRPILSVWFDDHTNNTPVESFSKMLRRRNPYT